MEPTGTHEPDRPVRSREDYRESLRRLEPLAESLIPRAREVLFVRPEDGVLVLRPNRVHYINQTAAQMLVELLGSDPLDLGALVTGLTRRYGVAASRVTADLNGLLLALQALLSGKVVGSSSILRATPFSSHRRLFPVLGEVALTYRCQNMCGFCYASSPYRGDTVGELAFPELTRIIDRMQGEAKIGTLSFTGGEPTLRRDLPELIAHARSLGLWVNLITNGLLCAEPGYATLLREAGLHSAQVSLEGGDARTHDTAVGRTGAFALTLTGIRRLLSAGIRTHTNATVHRGNASALEALVDCVAELGLEKLSMNMVIPTGQAAHRGEIGYRDIGSIVLRVKERCEQRGVRLVWYSPLPYCLFNPLEAGLGSPSCSAADGLLSVGPDGRVLPCSSFSEGLGNLLHESFETVWNRWSAKYWRGKKFLPPICEACRFALICCGACPLYWSERGSFAEIEPFGKSPGTTSLIRWHVMRKVAGRQRGVGL